MVLLLHAADSSGVLRVSNLRDGSANGDHVFWGTDVLPLQSPGDTVWIDGELAAHRVDGVKQGTRVTLLVGMVCPPYFTH